MKLRNKKTGAIYSIEDIDLGNDKDGIWLGMTQYKSIAELNEEWEDYEEPKGWCITMYGDISRITKNDEILIPALKEIGNYFNDKESAYDALDKLKAWKRLKDKGFRFTGCGLPSDKGMCICYETDIETWSMQDLQDFKLLFGGEE